MLATAKELIASAPDRLRSLSHSELVNIDRVLRATPTRPTDTIASISGRLQLLDATARLLQAHGLLVQAQAQMHQRTTLPTLPAATPAAILPPVAMEAESSLAEGSSDKYKWRPFRVRIPAMSTAERARFRVTRIARLMQDPAIQRALGPRNTLETFASLDDDELLVTTLAIEVRNRAHASQMLASIRSSSGTCVSHVVP